MRAGERALGARLHDLSRNGVRVDGGGGVCLMYVRHVLHGLSRRYLE